MFKIILIILVISIISVIPQAFSQISIGVPAEHISIKVTINENGDVHVEHLIKKNDKQVQIKLLPGKTENLQVVDGAGKEVQHAVSGDNSVITLFPPKVTFGVEYDLKDVLTLNDGVWTWDFLYTNSINGVEFYFPDNVDLVFVNERPIRIVEAQGLRCHGCDMFLEYVIGEPTIVNVEWEKQRFPVSIRTGDEIDSLNFDQPSKSLSFKTTGNKTIALEIPLELLWNPYEVYLDGEKIQEREFYQNETYVWLSMKPKTAGTIEIIGVSAIPEFSVFLPLVLGIAIVIGLQAKSKINLR